MKIQGANEIKLSSAKKKKDFIIYIDLDGVISNWLQAACDINEIDIKEPKLYKELSDGAFLDKIDWLNGESVWNKIDEEGTKFWSELKILPWGKKLVTEMEKLGTVYFLTSPGECVTAPTGKFEWIKKHFGNDYVLRTIICKDKWLCASPNSILVDDSEHKVDTFRENGGHSFLWPNCLKMLDNIVNSDETIDELKSLVQKYKK